MVAQEAGFTRVCPLEPRAIKMHKSAPLGLMPFFLRTTRGHLSARPLSRKAAASRVIVRAQRHILRPGRAWRRRLFQSPPDC